MLEIKDMGSRDKGQFNESIMKINIFFKWKQASLSIFQCVNTSMAERVGWGLLSLKKNIKNKTGVSLN